MARKPSGVGVLAAVALGVLVCRHEVRLKADTSYGHEAHLEAANTANATQGQDASQELRWAGDPEGGAPFLEASATDPDRLVGFDVV